MAWRQVDFLGVPGQAELHIKILYLKYLHIKKQNKTQNIKNHRANIKILVHRLEELIIYRFNITLSKFQFFFTEVEK